MKLSTKSRYALEGLFYMAIATLDRAASIKEIAAETPVSYTHLDVYKRQEPGGPLPALSCLL